MARFSQRSGKVDLRPVMFLLVGIVFLVESVVFMLVLGQIPSTLLGTTSVVAYVYAMVKFFAGFISAYVGVKELGK